jgi:hypothetical protein
LHWLAACTSVQAPAASQQTRTCGQGLGTHPAPEKNVPDMLPHSSLLVSTHVAFTQQAPLGEQGCVEQTALATNVRGGWQWALSAVKQRPVAGSQQAPPCGQVVGEQGDALKTPPA